MNNIIATQQLPRNYGHVGWGRFVQTVDSVSFAQIDSDDVIQSTTIAVAIL